MSHGKEWGELYSGNNFESEPLYERLAVNGERLSYEADRLARIVCNYPEGIDMYDLARLQYVSGQGFKPEYDVPRMRKAIDGINATSKTRQDGSGGIFWMQLNEEQTSMVVQASESLELAYAEQSHTYRFRDVFDESREQSVIFENTREPAWILADTDKEIEVEVIRRPKDDLFIVRSVQ